MLENVEREHGVQCTAGDGEAHEIRLDDRQGTIATPAVSEGRSRDVDAADPAVACKLLQPDARAAARVKKPRARDLHQRGSQKRMEYSTHADGPPVGALDSVELIVQERLHVAQM